MSEVIIKIKGPTFYAYHDEDAFFEWLGKIKAISEIKGEGTSLHLTIDKNIDYKEFKSLAGVLKRYRIDPKPLEVLATDDNRDVFRIFSVDK